MFTGNQGWKGNGPQALTCNEGGPRLRGKVTFEVKTLNTTDRTIAVPFDWAGAAASGLPATDLPAGVA